MPLLPRLLAACALAAPLLALSAQPPPRQAVRPIERAIAAYDSGDHAAAQAAFERLGQAGLAAADHNLALMHLRGQVRPHSDPVQARLLLERAAARGFVTAMFALGKLHEDAGFGAPRDLAQSHRWYLLAAEAGSADAQVAVGTAYYLGRGAPQDLSRAAYWYRQAAESGDVGAQYLLASMYETGYGLTRDLRLARYWYEAAAHNGDDVAPHKVRELDAKLAKEPAP
jgi:TPR repeat protein